MSEIGLHKLCPGESGLVTKITCSGGMRRRLFDIGLVAGTRVACVGQSPHKDPKAYLIRGAVMALRSEDAKTVQVHKEVLHESKQTLC